MLGTLGIGRLLRWCGGVLVLLIAHGLIASGEARAGCDNHLVTSQLDRLTAGLGIHRLDSLLTDAVDPSGPSPAAPRPCSGPGCSQGKPKPVPAAVHGVPGPDQWAAMAPAFRAPPRFSSGLEVEGPSARPSGARPSIFHPPPA